MQVLRIWRPDENPLSTVSLYHVVSLIHFDIGVEQKTEPWMISGKYFGKARRSSVGG